ncbi:recombinase family protein [Georhizobium sp. MAB10]|jgi:DNA invertase Pin-like site-specific DNA recombinase|uniref:recombinase family protein n=1 Tax=Georhizobium sp. MAB10 TaxID=3028319 RepID=UPI0038557E94
MDQHSCLKEFVAYYRVSTKRQGRSGLGLEAQRESVERFAEQHGALIGAFVDIESGRKDERTGLQQAIKLVRSRRASLLIARLDRFSRRVSFIAGMMDKGVPLVIAEMPHASEFQLHIFAALAQEERRMISIRTRAALQAAKQRGVKLGSTGKARAAENKTSADAKAKEMVQLLKSLPPAASLSEAAYQLRQSGWSTVYHRQPHPQSVKNYLTRLGLTLHQIY